MIDIPPQFRWVSYCLLTHSNTHLHLLIIKLQIIDEKMATSNKDIVKIADELKVLLMSTRLSLF